MIKCPASDWECPYYQDGYCFIDNPKENCDCFYDSDNEDFDEEGYNLIWGNE